MLSRIYRYFFAGSHKLTAAKDLVESAIKENNLVIFSKSWCPYCARAKSVFKSDFPAIEAKVYELDEQEDGDEIQAYLKQKTGQRTVPSIFIHQQFIGGSDAVLSLRSQGKLAELFTTTS